jgi:integrase
MQRGHKFEIGKYWIDRVPGSKRFYRFWYDAGARECRRRSLETSDFEEAKVRLAAFFIAEGEAQVRDPKDVALIAVLHKYWTEHSDRKPNPSAARRAGSLLLDFLGNTARVFDFTKAKQREFIAHLHEKGLSVAYISRIQAIVAAALNRAKADDDDEGMLLRAPRVIVNPKMIAALLDAPEPEPDNWHPTIEQIAAFMDSAETTAVLRCALFGVTFAGRPEAVRELGTDQFDERHGLLAFNQAGRRQTKKFRPTVPVPPRLLSYMSTWADADDLFVPGTVRKPWDKTLEKIGAKFAPKALRHFMATEMRKRGVPREQREEWMGHRRQSTGDRYGSFAPDYLIAAKDCADAVLGELEALCAKSIYRDVPAVCRQVAAKPLRRYFPGGLERFDRIGRMVGGTGIEPVTPTMST